MDAERFDAWQWVMWLLLCLAGLMPGEVAFGQAAETSSVRTSAAVVGVEQDVQVTAVGTSEQVAEEESMLSLEVMAGRSSGPLSLEGNAPHLNLRSTLIAPCLSNDRGQSPHVAGSVNNIADFPAETMHSSIGRISSRLTPLRALRPNVVA